MLFMMLALLLTYGSETSIFPDDRNMHIVQAKLFGDDVLVGQGSFAIGQSDVDDAFVALQLH